MSNLNEVEEAFATLVAQQAGALLVSGDSTFLTWRERLATLAAHHAVPALYLCREIVEAGGLMSYAMSIVEGYRTVGAYAARILNGEKPADCLCSNLPNPSWSSISKRRRRSALRCPPTFSSALVAFLIRNVPNIFAAGLAP